MDRIYLFILFIYLSDFQQVCSLTNKTLFSPCACVCLCTFKGVVRLSHSSNPSTGGSRLVNSGSKSDRRSCSSSPKLSVVFLHLIQFRCCTCDRCKASENRRSRTALLHLFYYNRPPACLPRRARVSYQTVNNKCAEQQCSSNTSAATALSTVQSRDGKGLVSESVCVCVRAWEWVLHTLYTLMLQHTRLRRWRVQKSRAGLKSSVLVGGE